MREEPAAVRKNDRAAPSRELPTTLGAPVEIRCGTGGRTVIGHIARRSPDENLPPRRVARLSGSGAAQVAASGHTRTQSSSGRCDSNPTNAAYPTIANCNDPHRPRGFTAAAQPTRASQEPQGGIRRATGVFRGNDRGCRRCHDHWRHCSSYRFCAARSRCWLCSHLVSYAKAIELINSPVHANSILFHYPANRCVLARRTLVKCCNQ